MRLLTKNKESHTMIIKVEKVTYNHMETAYRMFKRGLASWDSMAVSIMESHSLYVKLVGESNVSDRIECLYDTILDMEYGTIDQQKEAGINLVTMFS